MGHERWVRRWRRRAYCWSTPRAAACRWTSHRLFRSRRFRFSSPLRSRRSPMLDPPAGTLLAGPVESKQRAAFGWGWLCGVGAGLVRWQPAGRALDSAGEMKGRKPAELRQACGCRVEPKAQVRTCSASVWLSRSSSETNPASSAFDALSATPSPWRLARATSSSSSNAGRTPAWLAAVSRPSLSLAASPVLMRACQQGVYCCWFATSEKWRLLLAWHGMAWHGMTHGNTDCRQQTGAAVEGRRVRTCASWRRAPATEAVLASRRCAPCALAGSSPCAFS